MARRRTFHLISLGCPKNRVDTEVIWAGLAQAGLSAVDDPALAEVIIINTCAFIRSAVEESLDRIVQLGRYKSHGQCRLLLVAGCLPARYHQELKDQLPEVDEFIQPQDADKIAGWLDGKEQAKRKRTPSRKGFLPNAKTPRANSLSPGAAYVKVAEGCSRSCSFCLIPKLRGGQRSRSVEDLQEEIENLVRLGVREIVLVAQDLIGWGTDLPGKPALFELVSALAEVAGLWWLRLMYLFPAKIPDRLIRVISQKETVLPYLDLPFQHVHPAVLKRMRRGGDGRLLGELVKRLRAEIPEVVLRCSFMTGFPGETEEIFGELVSFIEQYRFERLGVFAFSAEEGSDAFHLDHPVPKKVAQMRLRELMNRQRKIAEQYHRTLLGHTLEVLVEEEIQPGKFVGRAWNQAPEVDGNTFLSGSSQVGEIVRAKIIKVDPYDLEAEIIG